MLTLVSLVVFAGLLVTTVVALYVTARENNEFRRYIMPGHIRYNGDAEEIPEYAILEPGHVHRERRRRAGRMALICGLAAASMILMHLLPT
jgi:hypothetical protein